MYRVLSPINFGHFPDIEVGEVLDLTPELAEELIELGVVEAVAGPELPLPDGTEAALPKGSPLINLNTASLAELMSLPRIGEATANKLIAARPLGSCDDARLASGLSEMRWAEVAPLATL